jgi:hypothetical protein
MSITEQTAKTIEQPVIALRQWARSYTIVADLAPVSEREARESLELTKLLTQKEDAAYQRRRFQFLTAGAIVLIIGLTFAGYCTRRVSDRYIAAEICNPRIEVCH